MKAATIKCPRCEGCGEVDLPAHLHDALVCIPKTKSGGYVENVSQKLEITTGAASMRLLDLVMLGLLKREREGKFWRYFRP